MHYKECILFKNDKWFNCFLNKTEKYSYFKKYDNKIDEVQKDTIEVKKAKIQANKRDVNARRIARATQNTSSETNDTFINIVRTDLTAHNKMLTALTFQGLSAQK